MKVLYHHRTSAQDGSAVHINGLIAALRELGAEVSILAPSVVGPLSTGSSSSWALAARKRLPKFVHEIAELVYNIPESLRLFRAVRHFKPDVIYQRSNLYLLSGSWVSKWTGIPLIEEVNAPYFLERSRHGGISLPRIAAWAEQHAWTSADAVIAVTGTLADMVAARGVARDRIFVMPNGIDEALLESRPSTKEAKEQLGLVSYLVLGFTGFVRDWNGLDAVLEILRQPKCRNWLLLVVGDGPARPNLESRAKELGVQDRVRFTGVVERDQVPKYVRAFDVALQPAANVYASPLKLFEYMALERAIVAPDQANIREILVDGSNALLFTPGRRDSFSDALTRLADDPALRLSIARCAAETIRQRDLTWRRNAIRVMALGTELVRKSPGALVGESPGRR